MHSGLRKSAYILVLAVLVALVVSKSWGQTSAAETQEERFQRTFTVTPGATLVVENYKGAIHVTGTDSNQVTIDVRKLFEGDSADRKWWMENLKIDFHGDPKRVEVRVDYPTQNCIFCWRMHDYTAAVELEIRVPRQMNVDVNGYKPDIRISAIRGDIAIKSYKAPMLIESTQGAIHIDTYKETVRLRDVAIKGALELRSYKADAEISAKSLGESANLETGKGSIVLRVPANAGMTVDFEGGRRSSFSSDFALSSSAGYSSREVRGTINQGGSRLHLRTERGSVELRKMAGEI